MIRREWAAAFDGLTVSVDGFGPRHDRLRSAPGAWARARDGARTLAGTGIRLRANVVLMPTDLDEFAALCDALANWGIGVITFDRIGGRDCPSTHVFDKFAA